MKEKTITAQGYTCPECKTVELRSRKAILDSSITGLYSNINDGGIGGSSDDPEGYDL